MAMPLCEEDGHVGQPTEELEGMLPGPAKHAKRRWLWVGLATTALSIVGIGLGQTSFLSHRENRSVLQRISMLHGRIGTIVAAAVAAKAEFEETASFVVDALSNRGSPPDGMVIKAVLEMGEQGQAKRVAVVLEAKPGKGDILKTKLDDLVGMVAQHEPRGAEMKKAVTIAQIGETVKFEVNMPAEEKVLVPKADQELLEKHEDDFDDALRKIKPVFHGKLALGHNFEQMHAIRDKPLYLLPGGIDVEVHSVIADAALSVLEDLAGEVLEHSAALGVSWMLRIINVFRVGKARGELYYDEELLKGLPPLPADVPTFEVLEKAACAKFPGIDISSSLAGLRRVNIEGLPGGWEVVVNFENFNPSSFLADCMK